MGLPHKKCHRPISYREKFDSKIFVAEKVWAKKFGSEKFTTKNCHGIFLAVENFLEKFSRRKSLGQKVRVGKVCRKS